MKFWEIAMYNLLWLSFDVESHVSVLMIAEIPNCFVQRFCFLHKFNETNPLLFALFLLTSWIIVLFVAPLHLQINNTKTMQYNLITLMLVFGNILFGTHKQCIKTLTLPTACIRNIVVLQLVTDWITKYSKFIVLQSILPQNYHRYAHKRAISITCSRV